MLHKHAIGYLYGVVSDAPYARTWTLCVHKRPRHRWAFAVWRGPLAGKPAHQSGGFRTRGAALYAAERWIALQCAVEAVSIDAAQRAEAFAV